MAPVSDLELDALRERGDAVLDPLVASAFAGPGEAGKMLGALFRSDHLPPDDARLRALAGALPPLPAGEPALTERGQQLFELYGPEILLILGCYALPAAYAAGNGVQVIHRSRRLHDDAKRRLCETAQMVLNVMAPGALSNDGIGARSVRKVRLIHALVRHHVRTAAGASWPASFGHPINQEDLAGTLLTFSLLVLDGLGKMGAEISPEERRGYLELWGQVGLALGLEEGLARTCVEDPEGLAVHIGRRQIRPTAEGTELAGQLAEAVNDLFPVPGYGLSLMHFFLDESAFGVDLARTLALPPANWTAALVRARAWQKRNVLRWLGRVPGARGRRRFMARLFAQRLILLQRPDKQTPFEVPPGFFERWRMRRR